MDSRWLFFPSLYCLLPEDVSETQMSHVDTLHVGEPLGASQSPACGCCSSSQPTQTQTLHGGLESWHHCWSWQPTLPAWKMNKEGSRNVGGWAGVWGVLSAHIQAPSENSTLGTNSALGIHPSSPDSREQTAVRHALCPKVHREDGSCFVTRELVVGWVLGVVS